MASKSSDIKWWAMLAYLLFFIPLLVDGNSKFGKFHANQGLILLILAVAVNVLGWILGSIPIIGWLVMLVLNIAVFVFFIIGILNAYNMKSEPLPIIGGFTIIK